MTPSKASARMITAAPAPGQTPASEVTPIEAAAEAIRNLVADDAEIQAAEVARALLAGDWLERTVDEHAHCKMTYRYADDGTITERLLDRGLPLPAAGPSGSFRAAHQAAAIRTAAGATR